MTTSNNNWLDTDELRQEILTEFKQVLRLAPADYTENCTNVVMSVVSKHLEENYVPEKDYIEVQEVLNQEWEAKLAEIEREARIDEHRVLDELAEQTANVDPDKAIDNYGAAKDRRLAALKHQGGE